MTTTATMKTATAAEAMRAKVVVLFLDRSKVGLVRQIGSDRVTTILEDALGIDRKAEKRVGASKRLFKRGSFKKINAVMFDAANYCQRTCISTPRAGMFVCPVALIEVVDRQLREYEEMLTVFVEELVTDWESIVQESVDALGSVGNRADYPSVKTMRQTFSLRHTFVTFDTPKELKAVSVDVFNAQRQQAQAAWDELRENGLTIIREQFEELVRQVVLACEPTADGKRRAFRETRKGSMLSRLNDFLSTFDMRNISDDVELRKLVEQSRQIVNGVDVKGLRTNEALRQNVAALMTEVKTEATSLVTAAPRRGIRFEEDDDDA
jgi:hypothetical protein